MLGMSAGAGGGSAAPAVEGAWPYRWLLLAGTGEGGAACFAVGAAATVATSAGVDDDGAGGIGASAGPA